jgi:rhodanese-related sulfurtransferase
MLGMENLFKNKGLFSSGILHVSAHEAFELCNQGAILVDDREEFLVMYKMFEVKETIFCPKSILEEKYLDLPKDKALIFADATGIHSKEAVLFLLEKGFKNIANLAGGLVEWERNGVPIKIDNSEMLSGSCTCQLRKRNINKK